MPAPRIYCDLDGVLADFVTSASEFFQVKAHTQSGHHNPEFDAVWQSPRGWRRLMREWPTFWMDLEPMPHALTLWSLILPYHPSILTAIPEGWPSSATGKHVWVKRYLPKFGYHPRAEFHAVKREQKQRYAKQPDRTPNILIDDLAKNVHEWEAAGGIGIIYVDGPNGIAHVRQALNSLT